MALLLIVPILMVAAAALEAGDLPPEWAYFGQSPPGPVPEVFAPDLMPGEGLRLHGAPAVSPDLRRICWSVVPPAIMTSVREDGEWSAPDALPIPLAGVQAPAFSPDGRRLYFQGIDRDGAGGVDLWWVDLESEAWGDPVNLGPPVNTPGLESQPSIAADGTLYFTGSMEGVGFGRGIYRAASRTGGYAQPEALDARINSAFIDYCPCVSADGDCLVFASSRPSAEEEMHLFASFRGDDGAWSEPVNIHGALGFDGTARFPQISPDARYLFFVSGDRAFWVDFAVVRDLTPSAGATLPE